MKWKAEQSEAHVKKTRVSLVRGPTDAASLVIRQLTIAANAEMPEGVSAFTIKGVAIGPNEMSSPDGVLPALVWHADRIAKYGMNRNTGLEPDFTKDDDSLLGHTVSLDRFSGVTAEAVLFLMEALHQAKDTLPRDPQNKISVDLAELVAEFKASFGSLQPRRVHGMS